MDCDELREWLLSEFVPESLVTVQEILDAINEPDYQFDTYNREVPRV